MVTERAGAKCVWKRIVQINQSFTPKFERYCGLTWPGWIRISIWTATVVVLTGLMAHELSSNVDEFVSNNVIPQITVITPTGEPRPPNLTVCVPYYSGILQYVADWEAGKRGKYGHNPPSTPCDECEGMKNNSWDLWTMDDTMFTNTNMETATELALVLVKRLFNDIDDASIALNETNAHWNQAIVDSLWRFYSCKVDNDRYYLGKNGHAVCPDDYMSFSSFDYIPDKTIDQMFELLLKAIEVYMELRLLLTDNDERVDGMRNLTSFIPLGDKMCFSLPWNTLNTDFTYYGVLQDFNYYEPWYRPNPYNITTRMEIYEDVMFHDFDASQKLCQTEKRTLGSNNYWIVQLKYNLQTQIDVKGQSELCSEDSVPRSCVSKRQFDKAVQECKCIPFLLRDLRDPIRHQALPYCNQTLYEPCKDKLQQAVQPDVNYCTDRCEYTDYRYWQVIDSTSEHDRRFGLQIELLPANGSYIKFNFTTKSTFGQFMSGVGGTLNLYLGLSGFTLCALLFFLIDSINRWRRLRPNSDQQSNPSPAILGLHLFWFTRLLQTSSTKDTTQDNSQGQHEDYTKKLLEKLAQDMVEMNGNFTTLADRVNALADRMNALERKSKG